MGLTGLFDVPDGEADIAAGAEAIREAEGVTSTSTYVGEESYSNFLFYYNSHLSGDASTWSTNTFGINECFSDAKKEMAFTPLVRIRMVYDVYASSKLAGFKPIEFGVGYHEHLTAESLGINQETFNSIADQLVSLNATTLSHGTDTGVTDVVDSYLGAGFFGDGSVDRRISFIATETVTLTGPIYSQQTYYELNPEKCTVTTFVDGEYVASDFAALDAAFEEEIFTPPGSVTIIGDRTGDLGEEETAQIYYDSNHIRENLMASDSTEMGQLYAVFGTLYTDLAFDTYNHNTPPGTFNTGEHAKAKLVFKTPEPEARYINKLFGYANEDTGEEDLISMSDMVESTLSDISSRIYETLTVDRYAYSRTSPQTLEEREIKEFSALEPSNPITITAASVITGSSGGGGMSSY